MSQSCISKIQNNAFIEWLSGPSDEKIASRAFCVAHRVLNVALFTIAILGMTGVLPTATFCITGISLAIAATGSLCLKLYLKKDPMNNKDIFELIINIGCCVITIAYGAAAIYYAVPWKVPASMGVPFISDALFRAGHYCGQKIAGR